MLYYYVSSFSLLVVTPEGELGNGWNLQFSPSCAPCVWVDFFSPSLSPFEILEDY